MFAVSWLVFIRVVAALVGVFWWPRHRRSFQSAFLPFRLYLLPSYVLSTQNIDRRHTATRRQDIVVNMYFLTWYDA